MAKLLLGHESYLYFELNRDKEFTLEDYNYFYITIPKMIRYQSFCFTDHGVHDIDNFIDWLKDVISKDFKEKTSFNDLEDEFEAEIDEDGEFNIYLSIGDSEMANYIKISDINKEEVKSFYLELKKELEILLECKQLIHIPVYKQTEVEKCEIKKKYYEKEEVTVINPNESNKDYLCARARFKKYGKMYTYFVDEFNDTSIWCTEDTGQEVIIVEFLYLNKDELPVPVEQMKKLVCY